MASRKKMSSSARMMLGICLTVIFVGAWQMWADSAKPRKTSSVDTPSTQLMKVVMPESTPAQLIHYTGFDVSFNPALHIPNWVAWELTRSETLGTESRKNQFVRDEAVKGCPETYDYSYSGYDRGHMCPAGDMKWSKQSMSDSFYLTNICPQLKSLNTGAWKRLEEKCRQWAKADSAIIIVCGPVLTDNLREAIGDTRVAVPERFFKVILSPFANPPRGIGFIMKNGRVEGGMQKAAVSIDEVERITGLDFFSALPDSVESVVESQCDFPLWSRIR